MKYTHKKYDNGLNLFLLPLKDAESVVFTIMVKVGSRYEEEKLAGITHFLEHMFFKGSKKYPTAELISTSVDAIGGDWNAMTGKETTEFYIRASKKNFKFIFELLTDMLHNPLFDVAEMEREKGVIFEEMKMYRDNPRSRAEENLDRAMWPNTRLGEEIIGDESSLKGIAQDDLFNYWRTWYVPANMVLGVAGNFDEKLAESLIKKTWGALPKQKVSKMFWSDQVKINSSAATRMIFESRKIEQTSISLGFISYAHADKRIPALRLLSSIIGGGMSSRLFMKLREKMGLAYSIYAYNEGYYETGMFMINAGLKHDSVDKALSVIGEELKALVKIKVTEAELKKTKEQSKGRMALGLEDPQSKLDFIIGQFVMTGKVLTTEEVYRRLDKVTVADVQNVAKEIFSSKRMALSAVGPITNQDELKKSIKI